jgi:outer membrane protein OmpA-like peptidoglycan-associated protein
MFLIKQFIRIPMRNRAMPIHYSFLKRFMLQNHTTIKAAFVLFLLFMTGITGNTQTLTRNRPVWWFGESVAANFNQYRGTTQMLNPALTVPTAFHEGKSVRPYVSVLTEYRPGRVVGLMLNAAWDNRGGDFEEVMAPCNCPANLNAKLSYLAIEPSVRIAPFASAFYLFAGPTFNINLSKQFQYTQLKQPDTEADFSDIRKTVFSAQAGMGIDIPVSRHNAETQMTLSPFASFQTDFGHEPRTVESWSFYTIRAGLAIKLGTRKLPAAPVIMRNETNMTSPPAAFENEVQFTVRAPRIIPLNRQVKETFPLRNAVFFDMGSAEIPARYIRLNSTEATAFNEALLQENQPDNLNKGRSARQLLVYHNILNIMGDRMRANPQTTITLSGASDKNPSEGRMMAENVKQYLVTMFGIDAARIRTEGRDKPAMPSEQPGAAMELNLLREEDRRVDIASTSPELLLQVGGINAPFLRPVQINAIQFDPLDSHVVFTVKDATTLLRSWSVAVKDEQGQVQQYGPFIMDNASVPGKNILGTKTQGNYTVTMTGETNTGKAIRKESSVSLLKADDTKQPGLRYSILFDFDRSKSVDAYEKFLTDIVAPLVPDNGTVIVHGHTDMIGEESYNRNLSRERATNTQLVLERALNAAGKKGVRFETYGFGEDAGMSPFENNLPEEHFYNRTVIIDILLAGK